MENPLYPLSKSEGIKQPESRGFVENSGYGTLTPKSVRSIFYELY